METVRVEKVDEAYNRIIADPSTIMEMSIFFTFDVPGAKFTPQYRNKVWDGKIRLLNTLTGRLYGGLLKYVEEFCAQRGYNLELADDFAADELSLKEAKDFVDSLNIPKEFEDRDYQIDAFTYAVRNRRALLLSPTSSGKSFIIYLLTRFYNVRTLIIVPTTSLVHQLSSDFADYGFDSDQYVHKIHAGQDKTVKKQITITTWQSAYELGKPFFQQFDMVIGDEAHLFKAKSLMSIMQKLNNCQYRFGFTGTLDGTQTHRLVLEGLFGAVKKVISTAELMEQGYIAKLFIKAIVLKYPDVVRSLNIKKEYQAEMEWLVKCAERNNFIKNLTLSLEGNSLLLFQYVDKHGKVLYDLIKSSTDRPVFYVHGGVDGEDREEIRRIVEREPSSVIVASYGTFSTGVNIRNLHNVIFASPSKSKIRNLQSIGRGLRKSATKSEVTLYDIADDLSWKAKKNFTLLHFVERVKIYNEEKFEYKIYPVNLKVE